MTSTELGQSTAPELRETLASSSPADLNRWLAHTAPAERAYQLSTLSKDERRTLGTLLDRAGAAELFDGVDGYLSAKVLRTLAVPRAAELLSATDADRGCEILRHLKSDAREQLLAAAPPEWAEVVRGLLAWPQESVGAHMVPAETMSPSTTVQVAVADLRARADAAGEQIYVVESDRRLLGVVPFRALVLAAPDAGLAGLVDEPVTVRPDTNAEDAAHLLADRRLPELAVVDDGHLLGILTEDRAAEIIADETTEDAEKQGGSEPLEMPYLQASPWLLWRKRIVWLLVLFVAEAYTGTVLRHFEDEMEAVVALAFFIPLLIGTGGNTGTQITTTLVRAMGTGQVRFRDMPAVVAKELCTASMIAVAMALAGLIRAFTLGVGPQVMLTVALTLAAIVLWSALVSSVLPLLLKQFRIDPAVVSAPMIATIVDGTGLMIYFLVAHATLPELAGL